MTDVHAFYEHFKLNPIPESEMMLYPLPKFDKSTTCIQPIPVGENDHLLLIVVANTPCYNSQTLTGYAKRIIKDRHPIFLQFLEENQYNFYIPTQDCSQTLVLSGSQVLPFSEAMKRLAKSDTLLDFLCEAENGLKRRDLEAAFVRQFKKHWLAITEAWKNLSEDTLEIRQKLTITTLLRLLFIAFLQEKYLLDQNLHFMLENANKCVSKNQNIYAQFLVPLFFNTLNTPPNSRPQASNAFANVPYLNGGLFQRTEEEKSNPRRTLKNNTLLPILEDLYTRYNYKYDEARLSPNVDSIKSKDCLKHLTESYLDPMMLGHVFESLMHTQLRSSTGSFYTPRTLSYEITLEAIAENIAPILCVQQSKALDFCSNPSHYLQQNTVPKRIQEKLLHHLNNIKLLDPTVGSGALLIHAYEHIFHLQVALHESLNISYDTLELSRHIITQSLHGVDILPEAVQICELRLWLATISHYPDYAKNVPPLPNLDLNIQCGNALFEHLPFSQDINNNELCQLSKRLQALKAKYWLSSSVQKTKLTKKIGACVQKIALILCNNKIQHINVLLDEFKTIEQKVDRFHSKVTLSKKQLSDKKRLLLELEDVQKYHKSLLNNKNPQFSFKTHFSDILSDGGFDIIIGNPPWLPLHKLSTSEQQQLKQLYKTATPTNVKRSTNASFLSQAPDLAGIFFERATQITQPDGTIAMILPQKLFSAPSYQHFRNYVIQKTTLKKTFDWTQNQANPFKAANYPAGLLAQNTPINNKEISMDTAFSSSSRDAFEEKMQNYPKKLHEVFKVRRGIFTGANPIFIPQKCYDTQDPNLAQVDFGCKDSIILEKSILKPVLKGANVQAYQCKMEQSILFPYQEASVLNELPEHTKHWLTLNQAQLLKRKDLKPTQPYYTLFRVYPEVFQPKVIWKDLSKELQACFLPDNDAIPLNTVYYIPVSSQEDGYLLAAYLNSKPIRKYTDERAEIAQSNYKRFFAWLINELPWPFPHESSGDIIECSKILHNNADVTSAKDYIDHLVEQALKDSLGAPRLSYTSNNRLPTHCFI